MSADTPTPQADGPHLDELATSAALDGEATTEEQAHLAACAACRAEVARLRAVQERLGASATEAPDPTRRERSIAAALDAFEPHGRAAPAADPTPLAQTPVRRAPVTQASRTAASAAGRRRRRRTADLAPWLGIAAVVLLVALAVPLLSRLGGDSADETAAGGDAGSEESAADESATAAAAPAVDVGDLGPLAAGSDLRPVVDDALGGVGAVAGDGSGPEAGDEEAGEQAFGGDGAGGQAPGGGSQGAPATGGQDDTEAAGGATESESEADGGAEQPDATVTTPSPTDVDAGAPQLADGTDGVRASRLTTCEPSVRASLPDAGALLLTGTATVDGAPALVYGFAAPTTRPTVLVALVAVDGCRTITIQTYARD